MMRNKAAMRIVSMALALLLPLCLVLPGSAAAGPVEAEKEEVVYVRLSHDGRVDTIYVVNGFTVPRTGVITDAGSYSEVRNLTTTAPISSADGTVSVTAPAGKFYYEGVLGPREIPWDVSVEYLLDGRPITGEQLAGRSGHLEMTLRIHQNTRANPVYTDNYAIQASLSLDGERCENIEAQDATVASVGKNKQLSYIILPGKEGDFRISADVVDFEMDGISINGIPLSLNIDDPDTEEIKDKIAELQDGAVELDDGAWELDDGARELNDGAVDLDDGAAKLDDGVLTLEDGVTELEDGVEELRDGADDLRDGANELFNGTRELRDGVDDLAAGVSRLSSGASTFGQGLSTIAGQSSTLTTGSAQVLQGLQTIRYGMSGMDREAAAQMTAQAAELQAASQLYLDTLDRLIAGYEAQLRQSLSLGDSGAGAAAALQGTVDMLRELRASYAAINAGTRTMTGLVAAQGEALPALTDGVEMLAEQYAVLDSGLTLYTQGVGQLYGAYGELSGGVGDLTDGVDDLADGAKELRDGAREMFDGTYDLQDGVGRLTDGVAELRDGATELRDGTVELKDGTVELLDGALELLDGTTELLDGTTELREKTADMDQEIDDRIDDLLEEYRGKDFQAVSFVDAKNTVTSVQFVMLTDSIALDDEPDGIAAVEESAAPTLWQRFLNLFAFLWRKE